MSTRESSLPLRVAVVVLVFSVIMLAVTSYLSHRQSQELTRRMQSVQQELSVSDKRADQLDFQVQYFHHIVGHKSLTSDQLKEVLREGNDADMKMIHAKYVEDVQTFSQGGLPLAKLEQVHYRLLPHHMLNKLISASAESDELHQETYQLTQRLESERNTREQLRQKLVALNESQRATSSDTRLALLGQIQSTNRVIDELTQKLTTQTTKQRLERQRSEQRLAQLLRDVQFLEQKLAVRRKDRDIPPPLPTVDGYVEEVKQSTRLAYIGLGSADGLQRQTRFAVFNANDNLQFAAPKATIEVTRILDEHLSEARIVSDKLLKPVQRQDVIYSAAWDAGIQKRFAVAGAIDLDGDGQDDRTLVKAIIRRSGGSVTAELLADGTRVGTINDETDYILQGEFQPASSSEDFQEAYSHFVGQAELHLVPKLTTKQFQRLFGAPAGNKVKQL